MHFNSRLHYDYMVEGPADMSENYQILLQTGLTDASISIADIYHQSIGDCNPYQQHGLSAYDGDHRPYEDILTGDRFYPTEDRDFQSLLDFSNEQNSHSQSWKTKHINDWTGADTRRWICDTALSKKMKAVQIPIYGFSNVTGLELSRMSKETFCEIFNTDGSIESSLIGDVLYEELQNILQEAVVPATVLDKYNGDEQTEYDMFHNNSKLLDMDSSNNNFNITEHAGDNKSFNAFSDSGYDSSDYETKVKVMEDQSIMMENTSISNSLGSSTIVKRPPGRPKGSGKKLPKRIKNVSVPEFLRDLLLDSRYCPRIIKWEDYSMGKFRFVRANEVAELWGGKKNNPKMSFEKFSRAMRYHYKQEVLVSVPTARLVYQFGPKAPEFTTENPNFESPSLSAKFSSR